MRRGFTIIELLVASMLLGMLVTILTMVFNQSSIAWRTGAASIADLSVARQKIAVVAEEADNTIIWGSQGYKILSPWKDAEGRDGLRTRACDADDRRLGAPFSGFGDTQGICDFPVVSSIQGDKISGEGKTYIVNVMSAGPDKKWETYDDIWSFPEWQ